MRAAPVGLVVVGYMVIDMRGKSSLWRGEGVAEFEAVGLANSNVCKA